MASVAVDANVLIAARLSRDQNHESGQAIGHPIDSGTLPSASIITDVLEEISNSLQAPAGHVTAAETLDAIIESGGFTLERTTTSDFDAGRSLFRRYQQRSLTDAVLVAVMHRNDVEYLYSFDDGFDGVADITRLPTPDTPFDR